MGKSGERGEILYKQPVSFARWIRFLLTPARRPSPVRRNDKWFFAMLLLLLGSLTNRAYANSILSKNITVHVTRMRLGTVLKTIEEKGNFYFSYNSNIVKTDSLVTVNADNQTIKEVLDQMLSYRFEYHEAKNFVILRYAPLRLNIVTDKAATEGDSYTISGTVTDEQTGKKLPNASVYSHEELQSVLTDKDGHFDLNLHNQNQPVTISISKEFYKDTTITFLADVKITSTDTTIGKKKTLLGYILSDDYNGIEKTSLGKLFLSTKQQVEAANLRGLIAQAPFQASAIPGVSTHGDFGGQIVNIVSLNAVGGYNAGVDGFEMGLIFNLDKGDVGAVQIAGVFNVVGGSVNGVQLGGLYNNVLGNVRGIQLSLLHNSVKQDMNGIQLSGLYNHTRGSVRGIQLGAIGNIAGKNSDALQLAAVGNIVGQKFSGVQAAAVFNYAKHLTGVQIGLVNIADTSSGFSIGLLNIIKSGYHKLAISTNETQNLHLAFKNGNNKLYTIWQGGMRFDENSKLYSFGLGFGREFGLGRKLAINTELGSGYLYQGTWLKTNLLNRFNLDLTFKVSRLFSIAAGPSLNFLYSDQRSRIDGYAYARDLHHSFIEGNRNWTGWVGWSVGINLF